jgi:quercetin dioxygenase-like cupin family protein
MVDLMLKNWKDRLVYAETGPQPQVLEENERHKVILAGLEPGQKIPEHPEGSAVYIILEGSGWMVVDGERLPVEAGSVVTMGNGAARGMEAETHLAFLAVRTGKG